MRDHRKALRRRLCILRTVALLQLFALLGSSLLAAFPPTLPQQISELQPLLGETKTAQAQVDNPSWHTGVLTITKTISGTGSGPFEVTIQGPNGFITTTTVDESSPLVLEGIAGGTYTVTEHAP